MLQLSCPGRRAFGVTFRLALGSAILTLAGCVSMGPQGERASVHDAAAAANSSRAIGSLTTEVAAWPAQDWWRTYGDPQLDVGYG